MRATFGRGRRLLIALNVGAVVLLSLAVWAGLNVLATRPDLKRVLDFSPNQRFSLSAASEKLLVRLRDMPEVKVEIHTFYQYYSREQDPAQINQRLVDLTTDLIKQYANFGGDRIVVVPHSMYDLFEAREAKRKLGVTDDLRNAVVVNLGKRSRVLGIGQDLGDVEYPGGMGQAMPGAPQVPVLKGYKGEEAITSAIQSLLDEGNVVAYFLAPREKLIGTSPLDLFRAKSALAGIGIDARPLDLRNSGVVPADAAVVVIPDPITELPDPDHKALDAFLDRGGKLLLSASYERGEDDPTFGELAARLGVRFSTKLLCAGIPDPANPNGRIFGDPQCMNIRRVLMNREHPVTRDLAARDGRVYLVKCRAIAARNETPGVTVDWLVATDESGFEEVLTPGMPQEWSPRGKKTASYLVALAVSPKESEKPFKAVVLTGYPLINAYFDQNSEFVLGAFRWLTDRTHLVTVPAKRYAAAKLELSSPQVRRIQWLLVGFLPGALALAGFVVLWFRRR